MNKTILFVTHNKKQCGVYEFGINIYNAIKKSTQYNFVHVACDSLQELKASITKNNPSIVIYNYHPSVMPWV